MKRDYISLSALKQFARSPNHYIQYIHSKREPSTAMTLGSAIHCALLEPKELEKRYAFLPSINRRTKAGKEAYEQFQQMHEGKEILPQAEYERLLLVRDAVSRNPDASHLLQTALAFEQSRTEIIYGNTPWKGIADIVGPDWVADLKTAKDASPDAFQRTAHQLMYHEQAVAYRRLFKVDKFYWIVAETEAPWNVSVYVQSEDAYKKAEYRITRLLTRFEEWDGQPEGYTRGIQVLNLPHWA